MAGTAIVVSACAPASTTGQTKREYERLDGRSIYLEENYIYTITEFDNSLGEHCTVVSRGSTGLALHCVKKPGEELTSIAPRPATTTSSSDSNAYVLESSNITR